MATIAGEINWLLGLSEKLAAARDVDSSLDVLQETLQRLGWQRLVYGWKAAGTTCDAVPVPVLTREFPENWDQNWTAHSAYDPYFQQVYLTGQPVRWSSVKAGKERLGPKQVDCMHYIEDLGLGEGLTVPVCVSGRRFAFVTALDYRAREQGCDEAELRRQAELIKVVAHFFDNHMIGVSALSKKHSVNLSPREKECLHWTAQGKTVDDVAMIVGISSETAKVYVKRIISKMNATNKTHAVAKAIHLGIVTIN